MTVRVALTHFGEANDPAAWSGTPAGLAAGLEETGLEVVRIGLAQRTALERVLRMVVAVRYVRLARRQGRRARDQAELGLSLSALRSRSIVRATRRHAAHVDGFVQVGGGPAPPLEPYALYEDATIVQVRRLHPTVREWPTRGLRGRYATKRRAYARATALCATTPWAAASMVDDLGADPAKVHVVGIGRNAEPEPVAREWWPPRFLFAGRDWVVKNGDTVVRAFARVRDSIPEARLDLAGKHPRIDHPGVFGHGLQQLAAARGRERVADLFEQATCYVQPSRFDASPISVVEASSAGIPSIVSSVGGSDFLVGVSGRICDPDDEDALVHAMLELSEPQTAQRLGGLALERSRLFTWRLVAERVVRALALPGVDLGGLADFLADEPRRAP